MITLKAMDDEPFKKRAKYSDLYDIPDNYIGEIIDGDLYAFPRARVIHGRAITRLAQQLEPSDDDEGPSGWIILADVEIWFGKHLLVPDLAGWRRSRMPELPDVASLRITPDWVCEGLSPSTARLDKGRKREIYEKYRVGHLWFADPTNRTVDVLALGDTGYVVVTTATGDRRRKLPPFSHAIDIAKLWKR
jgi:Uma2 family endonuclease